MTPKARASCSVNNGTGSRTRRVKNWQDHAMAALWLFSRLICLPSGGALIFCQWKLRFLSFVQSLAFSGYAKKREMNSMEPAPKTKFAIVTILAILWMPSCAYPKKGFQEISVSSPDRKICVSFELYQVIANGNRPVYNITFNDKPVVIRSELGLEFQNAGLFKRNFRITQVDYDDVDEIYSVVNGKIKKARNHYQEANITLEEIEKPNRQIGLVFRVFNDGVAFRYTVPEQAALNEFIITSELSHFTFKGDPKAYYLAFDKYQNSHEGSYQMNRLSEIAGDATLIDLPVLLEIEEDMWVGITEASLVDYAGMYLKKLNDSYTLQSDLTPSIDDPLIKVTGSTPHSSPWRVVMIADSPGKLIESNIVLNLNEPCQIEDTAWIKPGKTTWHWWNGTVAENVDFKPGMNTATMKHYIDFCAESRMDYHSGGFRAITKDQFSKNRMGGKNNIGPNVMGTRCHHLAMYVVFENPVPMVCDYPSAYKNQPGFEFIQQVPTIWDETKVINAQAGDYITIARKHKNDWYIGTMTDWTARELKIQLDFLSAGNYAAEVYADAADSERNPNNLLKSTYVVSATNVIAAKLASGGGQVIKLSPTDSNEGLPKYPGQ